jgi:hypothetical protein
VIRPPPPDAPGPAPPRATQGLDANAFRVAHDAILRLVPHPMVDVEDAVRGVLADLVLALRPTVLARLRTELRGVGAAYLAARDALGTGACPTAPAVAARLGAPHPAAVAVATVVELCAAAGLPLAATDSDPGPPR